MADKPIKPDLCPFNTGCNQTGLVESLADDDLMVPCPDCKRVRTIAEFDPPEKVPAWYRNMERKNG